MCQIPKAQVAFAFEVTLSSASPPLSHESVLRTNAGLLRSRKSELSKQQRRLLNLVNGKRTLAAVVAASRMPRKRAMETLEQLAEEGLLEVVRSSSHPKQRSAEKVETDRPSTSPHKAKQSRLVGVVESSDPLSEPRAFVSKRRTLMRGSFVVPVPSAAASYNPATTTNNDPTTSATDAPAESAALQTAAKNPLGPPGIPSRIGEPSLDESASLISGRTLIGGLVSAPAEDANPTNARASIVPHSVISLGTGSFAPAREAPPESVSRHGGIDDSDTPVGEVAGDGAVQLGRYEVVRRIGRGGMGSVYLCRLQGEWGFSRLLALKVLRGHLAGASEAHEEFLREARLASQLTHPNVVPILDVGRYEEQPFIVMQYIEGVSLSELVSSEASTPPSELVVAVVLDALAGLDYAHNLRSEDGNLINLVHCDVSPHNLLVGLDGSSRVADFGVAQARVAGLDDDGRPVSGKPGYASPEQLNGGELDARSDVYSMGVTLWNALTGQSLFSNNLDENTISERSSEIRAPSAVSDSPEPLDEVCLKALALSPDDRFQTAEEMLRALRRVAVVHDLVASPRSVGEWVQRTAGTELEARRVECSGERQSFLPAPKKTAAGDADAVQDTASLRRARSAEDSAESEQQAAGAKTVATAAPIPEQLPPITKTQAWTFAALAIATLSFAGLMIFKPELIGSTMHVNPDLGGPTKGRARQKATDLAAASDLSAKLQAGKLQAGAASALAAVPPAVFPVAEPASGNEARHEDAILRTQQAQEASSVRHGETPESSAAVLPKRRTGRRTRVWRLRKAEPAPSEPVQENPQTETEVVEDTVLTEAPPPHAEIITVDPPRPLPGAPPPPPPASDPLGPTPEPPPVKRNIYD